MAYGRDFLGLRPWQSVERLLRQGAELPTFLTRPAPTRYPAPLQEGVRMIRSMTGYGSAEIERDGQRLTAEVRSVNHRFCEVSIRAPKLVSPFEDQVRQLIQDRFARGKINLTITWSGVGETGETLKVNDA